MGWFSKGPNQESINEVREEIRLMEARLKGLETEWASVFQKVSRAVGHITKTNALAAPPAPEPTAAPQPPRQSFRDVESLSRDEIANMPPIGIGR